MPDGPLSALLVAPRLGKRSAFEIGAASLGGTAADLASGNGNSGSGFGRLPHGRRCDADDEEQRETDAHHITIMEAMEKPAEMTAALREWLAA